MSFPKSFYWGAATSSYQIEGAHDADGKGASVWDTLCRKRGAIYGGHTGDVACDHYHQFAGDVGLMQKIGLQAYRFSLSWPRVVPSGIGEDSQAGWEFYERLSDALSAANITPHCTLFHWDLPQDLQSQGGWQNPDSPKWFGDYAEAAVRRLGSRIRNWITFNEPGIFLTLGHLDGIHAPALKLSRAEVLTACKNVFLAHGEAVRRIRELDPSLSVSYAPHCVVGIPKDESDENIKAAREYTFGASAPDRHFWQQRLYLDPVLKGEWPHDLTEGIDSSWRAPNDAETRTMSEPIDVLGLNFYSGPLVGATETSYTELPDPPGMPRTVFDWPVRPEGLYWAVRFNSERYGLPISITENGLSSMDWVDLDGRVPDFHRIDFLRRYLLELQKAVEHGYKVDGYFHWSLMDNFEWAEGYRQRFGLIHVDFQTLERTLKESAYWYSNIIRTNGAALQSHIAESLNIAI